MFPRPAILRCLYQRAATSRHAAARHERARRTGKPEQKEGGTKSRRTARGKLAGGDHALAGCGRRDLGRQRHGWNAVEVEERRPDAGPSSALASLSICATRRVIDAPTLL